MQATILKSRTLEEVLFRGCFQHTLSHVGRILIPCANNMKHSHLVDGFRAWSHVGLA